MLWHHVILQMLYILLSISSHWSQPTIHAFHHGGILFHSFLTTCMWHYTCTRMMAVMPMCAIVTGKYDNLRSSTSLMQACSCSWKGLVHASTTHHSCAPAEGQLGRHFQTIAFRRRHSPCLLHHLPPPIRDIHACQRFFFLQKTRISLCNQLFWNKHMQSVFFWNKAFWICNQLFWNKQIPYTMFYTT